MPTLCQLLLTASLNHPCNHPTEELKGFSTVETLGTCEWICREVSYIRFH